MKEILVDSNIILDIVTIYSFKFPFVLLSPVLASSLQSRVILFTASL